MITWNLFISISYSVFVSSLFYDLISQEIHHVKVAHVWFLALSEASGFEPIVSTWMSMVAYRLPVGDFASPLQGWFRKHSGKCNFV